jgi:hypothetical protein
MILLTSQSQESAYHDANKKCADRVLSTPGRQDELVKKIAQNVTQSTISKKDFTVGKK